VASNVQVEAVLRAEVERGRTREAAAHEEYERILKELCHDGSPDEIDHLEQASFGEIAARQELWDALLRLEEFRQNGTVPENLRTLSEIQQNSADCARSAAS